MKTLYQEIRSSSRWFYPEGNTVTDDPHTELRTRAAKRGLGVDGGEQGGQELVAGRQGFPQAANPTTVPHESLQHNVVKQADPHVVASMSGKWPEAC